MNEVVKLWVCIVRNVLEGGEDITETLYPRRAQLHQGIHRRGMTEIFNGDTLVPGGETRKSKLQRNEDLGGQGSIEDARIQSQGSIEVANLKAKSTLCHKIRRGHKELIDWMWFWHRCRQQVNRTTTTKSKS